MSGQDIGPLSATAQGMLDRRAEAIRVALDQTSGVNPDVFAEAVKIAPQLGDRPENIVHDVAGARELLQRKQFSTQEFQRQFPVLSDKLRDVRFMSMTRDDIGNLQTTEGAWDWIGQSWRTARDSSRSGTIGTRAMIEGRGLTKLEQREMQIANDRAAAYSERDNGFLGAGINLVGSMLDSALTGVAVAAVSGPAAPATVPAALYAQSFRLEAGNLYAQLVMNGHTPAEATKVALTYGSVVAGLEFVGIHSAAKPFKALFGDALPKLFARSVTAETRKKAFLHLARNYLEALAVEPTTEAMQEIVGMLGTDSVNPGKETFNFAQAGDVFMQTLKGMVVVGGVGAGSHFAVSMHKAADAVHAERVFKQLAEIEQESKLGDPKRSPDDRAEFVQQAAGKAQAPQVFIDGKEFSEVLRQADTAEGQDTGRQTTRDSLEKLLPGILEQVRVADETGSDVVLKTGDFVAKLGRTDLGRALMQHSRFDAEGYTPAEARKILAQQQEMSDQARALIQEKATSDKEFVDSAKRVEDAIYEQVKATGRIVDAKEARTAAQFYRDFVITQAARRGVTPEQFHAQYPLQVKREDGQTGARFDQLRTDTPEFKAWFGDSKVVDAEGKPQVYYHATGAQFSEFRRARLRGASFFSATPESAFTGASASANEGMAPYPDRTIPVYLAVPNLYGRSYVLPKGVPDVRGVYPANAGQESVEAVHAAIADALFSTDPSVNRLAKEIAVEEWGRWHHTRRLASGEWELYRTDHPSEVAGDTVVAIPETRAAMWWQTFERGPGGRADAPGVGSKALEALGYDGALISDEGVSTVAVFDGRRIKSVNNRGTFDPNDPNILRQNEAPAALVSALRTHVDALPTKATAASGWKSALQGLVNKGAVKQAEIEWTGLQDWLDLQDGKITKEQVQAFLDGNGVQVQTVQLGGETDAVRRQQAIDQELEKLDRVISYPQPGENRDEAIQQRTVLQDEWHSLRGGQKDAKFANYQLPGGTNYREVLLTLPEKPPTPANPPIITSLPEGYEVSIDHSHPQERFTIIPPGQASGRPFAGRHATREEAVQAAIDQINQQEAWKASDAALAADDARAFKSSHWLHRNVIAHLRLNDRTDADGKRVLFVEEIQSDWAQKGRKEGFQRQAPDEPFAIGQYGDGTWWAKDGSGVLRASAETREELDAALRGLSTQPVLETIGKIPRAPFVETTEGWLNLALKQVLLTAVNEGYDKVAFITGEQSAERYDLSKQVKSIEYIKHQDGYELGITQSNGEGLELPKDRYSASELEDVVGKEIAQKIVNGEGVIYRGHFGPMLEGVDLKVGGEGMRAFYDKIVPKAVEKLVKKMGGKMGDVTVGLTSGMASQDRYTGFFYVSEPGVESPQFKTREEAEAWAAEEGKGAQPGITITDAMRAEIGKGLALFQHGDEGTARGGFIPESLTILLHEKADSSTFFHEAAHAFLTIYADLAAKGDALATADMQTLLDWFGVKDMATWNAMSLEQQRKHHEKFAYSFEGYLYDGKAPSLEMQGLFDRFKVWLRRVYKTIRDSIGATYEKEFGEPLPILTGEVRGVMDRMLASEDAIAEAEAVRGMAAIYQTQEQSGMDDAAWAAYQDEARKAREAGVASLEKDSLRQMQWEHDARGRLLKAAQAQHKEVRDKVRREVVAEVAARPETRADRWLRTGRLLNEDGTTAQGDKDTNHKLDRATVEAMGLGPAETARLEPYLRADGLSPDAVAEQFGYDSGEGMLRALAAMKPFGEAVDARTTERMLAEHSDLADPAEVEAAVERALHNEVRARFVAIELRHLAKSTQPVRLMLAAAKEAARTAIANLPFREASAKKFAQNEARAARQVTEALRKGDSALAAEWQQKRLLQHALATVAGEFQEQAAKDLRNLSRFQRPDAKLAKTRDTDLVNAARWVLSRFNLGTPSQEATATRALTAIAKYDAAMSRQLAPLIQDADQNGRDYRDLTVEQFRDLMAKVDGLWNDSKRSQQIRIDGKLMERAVAREAIVAQLVKSGLSAAGKDQPIRRAVGSVSASLRHVESWALEMDGGQPGPVHKYLFQLLRDPVNDFLLERTQMRNELDVAIRKLPTLYGRKFEAKELIDQKTGKPHVFQNRHELVGFLLHAGNEDNLRIDAVGRGWVTLDADGNANLAPVWRFIERMVNEGHLTKADFDFAQNHVWDVFESRLKARAQEAHKDNYGYYFNEIEAKPITVRFPNGETATYRGGYMPAKADIDEDTRVGMVSVDGVTESGGEFLDRHPSAPKGFTITRTGKERALSHDLRLASQAFSEELQFIHLQRPGRDLASILNDKEVSAAIQGVDQRALQDMFFPWLQDTMRNRLMAPGGNPLVNKALIALRRNVGLAYMFGNISNGIQQLTGFATSLTYVPLKHLRAGMKLAMRASEREQMLADSKFMLLRLDKRMGQITDDIDLILNPTWLGNVQKWTQRHGYFLQQWFQAPVDVVTWLGAKDHAIAQGKTNAEAIVWADAAVRRSQGSGTAADISRLERSSAVVRLLTQFGGFWLASLNTILQRHGPEQAKATATIIAFAGVTAGALSQALKGGWDDDDEDGALWDDIAGWAVGEAAKTGASLVPVVGSMAYSLVTGDRGGRLSPAATLGAAEQGSRGLRALAAIAAGKRDAKGQDIKDVSLFLSVILGAAPASLAARPISYQFDVSRGNVQPTGPVDYARGLATGTPAPGTKK